MTATKKELHDMKKKLEGMMAQLDDPKGWEELERDLLAGLDDPAERNEIVEHIGEMRKRGIALEDVRRTMSRAKEVRLSGQHDTDAEFKQRIRVSECTAVYSKLKLAHTLLVEFTDKKKRETTERYIAPKKVSEIVRLTETVERICKELEDELFVEIIKLPDEDEEEE